MKESRKTYDRAKLHFDVTFPSTSQSKILVHSIFVTVVIVVLSSPICNLYHDVIHIFVISFCFQLGIHAELELPSVLANVVKSKFQCTYKEKIIPPGVATRNAWGPILFKYCRVKYNETSKKLEMVKGEFVGNSRILRGFQGYQEDSN